MWQVVKISKPYLGHLEFQMDLRQETGAPKSPSEVHHNIQMTHLKKEQTGEHLHCEKCTLDLGLNLF